jgi:flagellar P-ring protein precursor FlgI
LIGAALALGAGNRAPATMVQDLVRIKGHEHNVLMGMGIVVGLDGTGDTARDSLVAARPYAELLRNLGNAVGNLQELADADAFAIVEVTMRVPATGVREGDRVDVSVATLFNATSLAGGRLVVSPLRLPLPDSPQLVPLAIAEGPVIIEGGNARTGIVRNGGQMLADIRTNPITPLGTIGLVLQDQYAGYPVATTIAAAINDEFAVGGQRRIALVEDARNIVVQVPPADLADPANFIAAMQLVAIDPTLIQTKARIVINENEGIILVTGNVEISPVGITSRGLTISNVTPGPAGAAAPAVPAAAPGTAAGGGDANGPKRWTGLDTTGRQTRAATRLLDLMAALDQLAVPVEDQIAIIYELEKTGALHAEIVHQ